MGAWGQRFAQGNSIQQLESENKRLTQEVQELCSLVGNIVTGTLPHSQLAASPSLSQENISLKKEINVVWVYCIDQLKGCNSWLLAMDQCRLAITHSTAPRLAWFNYASGESPLVSFSTSRTGFICSLQFSIGPNPMRT